MHEAKFYQKVQLFIVHQTIKGLNSVLSLFRNILFVSSSGKPGNILIYKIGNIGDVICAVPSFIAIRRTYPEAKITLLTSPGKVGTIGAKELLERAWYINEIKVYYSEDIDSWQKNKKFISRLKENHYDLFIQFPDDLANFKTLLRNMIFAKLIGAKSAFGFKIRSSLLFQRTQIDFLSAKTEEENLIEILKENGVRCEKIEFDFNISFQETEKVLNFLQKKWGKIREKEIVVAINPGGKREGNQWPAERFGEVAEYLQSKYNAKIIIIGGGNDIPKAEIIKNKLKDKNALVAAGKLSVLETIDLLRHCAFLISNDTGAVHMASAIGLPVIGLYSIRYILGKWFPYGNQYEVLYHKFLDCDYRQESCVKKSIEMITVGEVIKACDQLINKIKI